MKDIVGLTLIWICLMCLLILAMVNVSKRNDLEKRVDFLEIQQKGQVFWHTNIVTVWKTNYMILLIQRIDK